MIGMREIKSCGKCPEAPFLQEIAAELAESYSATIDLTHDSQAAMDVVDKAEQADTEEGEIPSSELEDIALRTGFTGMDVQRDLETVAKRTMQYDCEPFIAAYPTICPRLLLLQEMMRYIVEPLD